MARIRTIKPEFWDSPGTARASLRARLFFIAMWNYADDWGVGDAHPLRLLSFAFPNDESSDVEPRNFRHLASEVAECFDVQWYEVDGRAYYAIPSWELHQRTEKKAKRKNPAPDQADSSLFQPASESPTLNRGNRHDGRGKGEEGKGKKEEELLPDESGELTTESPYPDEFEQWWKHYPRRIAKGDALKAWKQLKKDRILPSLDSLIAASDAYAAREQRSEFQKYPAGWLRAHMWNDEAAEARGAPARKIPANDEWMYR